MRTVRDILILVLLACGAFACAGIGLAGMRTAQTARATRQVVLSNGGELHALLLRGGKLLDDARGSVTEINRTSLAERHYFETELPKLNQQVSGLLQHGDGEMLALTNATNRIQADADTLTAHTTADLDTLNAQMAAMTPLEQQASATLHDVDVVVTDPAIPATFQHINSTTGHLDAMAGDTQKYLWAMYHPTKTRQFLNAIEGIGVTCIKVACW